MSRHSLIPVAAVFGFSALLALGDVWADKLPKSTKIAELPALEKFAARQSSRRGEVTLVPVEGHGSESIQSQRALRVKTLKPLRNVWEVQLCSPTSIAVRRGKVALLQFWARTIEVSGDEDGSGKMAVYFQRGSEPWDKSFLIKPDVPRSWTRFQHPFRIHERFDAGEAEICLGFGFDPQTIEIADVEVLGYPADVELLSLPRAPE